MIIAIYLIGFILTLIILKFRGKKIFPQAQGEEQVEMYTIMCTFWPIVLCAIVSWTVVMGVTGLVKWVIGL